MNARTHRTTLLIAILILGAFMSVQLSLAVGSADARRVVLGAHKFAPNGLGFGAAHPDEVYNGGVPSGYVRDIHWRNWGGRVTKGYGLGSGYKPSGGYYAKPIKVRLRADRIKRCRPHGPLAYTRLLAKVEKKPGSGRFTQWFRWSGAKTICSQ